MAVVPTSLIRDDPGATGCWLHEKGASDMLVAGIHARFSERSDDVVLSGSGVIQVQAVDNSSRVSTNRFNIGIGRRPGLMTFWVVKRADDMRTGPS